MSQYNQEASGCLIPNWLIIAGIIIGVLWVLVYLVGISLPPQVDYLRLASLNLRIAIFWGAIFFAIVFGGPMLVTGLLWAPFAAMICWRLAEWRGLNGRRYAVTGATYSILYFLPWVYLVVRLCDRTVPSFLVRGVYIVLYCVVWPLAALSIVFPAQGPSPFNLLLFVLLPSTMTWFLSLRRLLAWRKLDRLSTDHLSDGVRPDRVYIVPFALAYAWTLISAAAWTLFFSVVV